MLRLSASRTLRGVEDEQVEEPVVNKLFVIKLCPGHFRALADALHTVLV
jgi:hypothetical protein